MTMFLTSAVVIIFCYLAGRHVLGILRSEVPAQDGGWWLPVVMSVSALSSICCIVIDVEFPEIIAFNVMAGVCAVFPHTSFLFSHRLRIMFSIAVISIHAVSDVVLVLHYLECVDFLSGFFIGRCVRVLACVLALSVVAVIYMRLRDLKTVLKSGSVWTVMCLSVDYVYVVIMLSLTMLCMDRAPEVYVVMMAGLIMALEYRVVKSSVFIVMAEQERKIVESMRLSRIDSGADCTGTDQLYANIYERVLRYFEKNKPYLNHELTINDIVEVVFTNKLYISRAISFHTGRNFCQFVNYYRITYAVEIFRDNPQMKVVEMASRSGFNSTTSFNAAFRLYMGDKPSEWCRRERAKLVKRKNHD